MKYIYRALLLLPFVPVTALAIEPARDIQTFGLYLITFFHVTLLPFLFSLALLIFIYQVIRYFIIEINSGQGKEDAKRYALYSIIGFVLMVSIWGIVNLIVGGTGLGRSTPICPDFFPSALCSSMQAEPQTNRTGFGAADWGDDKLGEFGGVAIPRTDTTPAAKVGADAATQAVIKAISDSEILGGATNETGIAHINTLNDPDIPDNVKITAVANLFDQGILDRKTAQNYIDAINNRRAAAGQVQIIKPLDTSTDTATAAPVEVDTAAIRTELESVWNNAVPVIEGDGVYSEDTYNIYTSKIEKLVDDIHNFSIELIRVSKNDLETSTELQKRITEFENRVRNSTGSDYRTAAQEILELSKNSDESGQVGKKIIRLNIAKEGVLDTYTGLQRNLKIIESS